MNITTYYNRMTFVNKLELLASCLFIYLLVNLPEIDLNIVAKKLRITSRTSLYLFLVALALTGFWIIQYSKIIGGYVFIILYFIFTSQMRYVELFQDLTTTTQPTLTPIDKLNLSAGDLALAEDFLIKQTQNDPNKTDLEKNVVTDLIKQYFIKSNKLTELRDFNDNALKANPLAGPQEVRGLADGVV